MKKLILALLLYVAGIGAIAQPAVAPNPFPKTITVSGSAEMEIVPDEIYVNILLREYQKKGEDKKDLETIKTRFLENCKASGIPDSAISIASFTGYNNYYQFRKRKKDPDLMATITYQLKFHDSKTMDILVEKLDDEATQSFQIVNTSHSKMQEFRKQLKIKAIQAAKDKGLYLTEAISEKLGPAITITEPAEPVIVPGSVYDNIRIRGMVSNVTASGVAREVSVAPQGDIDFRKIKLRYEVAVIFALP